MVRPSNKDSDNMKTVAFTATAESAYGEKLEKPITYAGTYEAFENFPEVEAAKETLSNEEHTTAANNRRKAAAKAKAMQKAFDDAGLKKPDPNSPDMLRKGMIVNLMKQKPELDETTASSIIDSILGAV
jgi:hypothetical protein